jgi:hypothetical protein
MMNSFSDPFMLAYTSSSGGGDVVAIVAIVFICGFLIVKTITRAIVDYNLRKHDRGGAPSGKGSSGSSGPSDVSAIRQMQQTLTKMEERVEALETILIEHTRSQKL